MVVRKVVVHKVAVRQLASRKESVRCSVDYREAARQPAVHKVAVHKTVDCVVDNKTRFPVVRKGADRIHHVDNPYKGERYNSYFPDSGFFSFSS